MTELTIALVDVLQTTTPGANIIASSAESAAGIRSDVIVPPSGVANYVNATGPTLFSPLAAKPPTGGTVGQVLAKTSSADYAWAWTTAGVGDMLKAVYDPTNINASPFVRANQTGTQPVATITGLATVAVSGAYGDLSGLPTLGTAAAQNVTAFATAAQGVKADTAVQPSSTDTLSNKRINPRVTTTASTATLTPNADTQDLTAVSAQAAGLTIAAPTGTPVDGQKLMIRIRDNGVTRALSWNAIYSAYVGDLPTTTQVSTFMIYEFMYNTATVKWELFSGNPIPGKYS